MASTSLTDHRPSRTFAFAVRLLLLVGFGLTAIGCGHKGELVLPQPKAPSENQSFSGLKP